MLWFVIRITLAIANRYLRFVSYANLAIFIYYIRGVQSLARKKIKAEAAVTLRNNKKIAILTLNFTQVLTLTLIPTQTQNLTQTLAII